MKLTIEVEDAALIAFLRDTLHLRLVEESEEVDQSGLDELRAWRDTFMDAFKKRWLAAGGKIRSYHTIVGASAVVTREWDSEKQEYVPCPPFIYSDWAFRDAGEPLPIFHEWARKMLLCEVPSCHDKLRALGGVGPVGARELRRILKAKVDADEA